MHADPVILALASPVGRAARCMIRASGAQTFDVLRSFISLRDTTGVINETTPRGIHACSLHLGEHGLPALALVMHAPRSFTGAHTVELLIPGNPLLAERVIDAVTSSDAARRATAGEFSARAFMNGRMSLTQAEGIAASIAAESDAELAAARSLRSGAIGSRMLELADDLAGALALVEAGIDFTDQEDVVAITPGDLRDRLTSVHERIEQHLQRAVPIEQLRAAPWVVLVGKPNAGKSTLFNALLGRDRAVVSDIAGTTRDVLVEPMHITTPAGDAEVMLVDLAGLDEARPGLDAVMQAHAQDATRRADLIVHCVSIEKNVPAHADGLRVITKSDLARPKPTDSIRGPARNANTIHVSAHTGAGLGTLRTAIARTLAHRTRGVAADAVALLPRHDAALRAAADMLSESLALLAGNTSDRHIDQPELVAGSMRLGLDHLGAFVGNLTPDDVLERVFATFCIGK